MQIPGFEIIQELSRGPLTSVYVVRGERGKILLLKTLHPQHARDPEIYKRFRREAEVIKRLDHINIVKVYDHSTYKDIPYTVMAYIRGWNLRDFISRNHPLPLPPRRSPTQDARGYDPGQPGERGPGKKE